MNHLIEVTSVAFTADYAQAGRIGAPTRALLHPAAAARLDRAAQTVRGFSTTEIQYGLSVFDAFRPASVQRDIFDEYTSKLLAEQPTLPHVQAQELACTYVTDPRTVFPHGTGGTVDLTLTENDMPGWMGSTFDEFGPRSHRDWYQHHPPTTSDEATALARRHILDYAMTAAGFVGHPHEWWHFEFGTAFWAAEVGATPILTEVLDKNAAIAANRGRPDLYLVGY